MPRHCRLLLVLLLNACSGLPVDGNRPDARPAPDVPRGEVAIVINGNAAGGRHAGLFAGPWLSDPSGSYVAQRSGSPKWSGLSLADYVAYQLEDGDDVRVYRFKLNGADYAEIERRVRTASGTMPLFCAATVQSQIAGVGPFREIAGTFWTSPASLALELQRLLGRPTITGACLQAKGDPC